MFVEYPHKSNNGHIAFNEINKQAMKSNWL